MRTRACSSADALKRAQIKPLVPEAKEAISLINGTQAMLAVGTLSLLAAENTGRHRRCAWRDVTRRAAWNRRGV